MTQSTGDLFLMTRMYTPLHQNRIRPAVPRSALVRLPRQPSISHGQSAALLCRRVSDAVFDRPAIRQREEIKKRQDRALRSVSSDMVILDGQPWRVLQNVLYSHDDNSVYRSIASSY